MQQWNTRWSFFLRKESYRETGKSTRRTLWSEPVLLSERQSKCHWWCYLHEWFMCSTICIERKCSAEDSRNGSFGWNKRTEPIASKLMVVRMFLSNEGSCLKMSWISDCDKTAQYWANEARNVTRGSFPKSGCRLQRPILWWLLRIGICRFIFKIDRSILCEINKF